jgi:molybdate transport system permease protein
VSRTHPAVPWPARVLAWLAIGLLGLPFLGLLWRVPWSRLDDVLGRSAVHDALWLSLRTSLAATLVAIVLGVPLAWLLATVDFRGRGAVRALCTLSMVLPPVVGGVALFAAFGRRGLIGRYLDEWFGVRLPFTTWGVVLAQ